MSEKKIGQAGTVESNDVLVTVTLNGESTGIEITLNSPVERQFGGQIKRVINETLAAARITDALVHVIDRGALDFAICARVEAAIARAQGGENDA